MPPSCVQPWIDKWDGHEFDRADIPAYCLKCRMPRDAAAKSSVRCIGSMRVGGVARQNNIWDAIEASSRG